MSKKRFTGLSAEDKKKTASIRRAAKTTPRTKEVVKFAEMSAIYFVKEGSAATGIKCHVCGNLFVAGDAYVVSTNGRTFKHKGCELDKVKQ